MNVSRTLSTSGEPGLWLKAIGHARGPMPERWLEEDGWRGILRRTGFPRRPRMQEGDRLVYYASVHRKVFAVVEVVEEPRDDVSTSSRWPWTVAVAPLLVVPDLADAPPVEAAGVPPRSMSQQSHIRLDEDRYRRAVEALAGLALP